MLEILSFILLFQSIGNLSLSRKPYDSMSDKQRAKLAKSYSQYCTKQQKKNLPIVSEVDFLSIMKSQAITSLIVSIILICIIEFISFRFFYRNMF